MGRNQGDNMQLKDWISDYYRLAGQLTDADGYDGWMIGKCVWKCDISNPISETTEDITLTETNRDNKYAVLKSSLYKDGYELSLELHIVKPYGDYDSENEDIRYKRLKNETRGSLSDKEYIEYTEHAFTNAEILEFVDRVHDKNSIHRNNNAVVPGLLLLKWVSSQDVGESERGFNVKVRFKKPVYVGEAVSLCGIQNEKQHMYTGCVMRVSEGADEAFSVLCSYK